MEKGKEGGVPVKGSVWMWGDNTYMSPRNTATGLARTPTATEIGHGKITNSDTSPLIKDHE